MVKKIAVVLTGFFLVFAAVVQFQPNEFKISRKIEIKAPLFSVFSQVNILKNWEMWSPWAKLDPNVKNTYSGPEFGQGAVFNWSGNDDVGEGQMTIVESRNNEKVVIKVEFIRPIKAINMTEFEFYHNGDGTEVTWTMTGQRSFFEKAFNLLFNMDSILGVDFEKGLANMKQAAESESAAH